MNPLGKTLLVLSFGFATLVMPGTLNDAPSILLKHPEVGAQFHGGWTSYTSEDRAEIPRLLAAAGASWVRIDMGWCTIEHDGPGKINESYVQRLDEAVDAANDNGLKVLATMWCTPQWASGDPDAAVNAKPRDPEPYGDAMEWAAEYWEGRVHAWEIWNEPDLPHFYAGGARSYVQLLREGYRGVKAGDSDALVVLGAPVPNDVPWLEALYRRGAKPYFDVLATHPYSHPLDKPPDVADGSMSQIPSVEAVRALMVRRGDEDKPIWFTEFGWSSHPNRKEHSRWQRGVTREEQAEYLTRAIRLVACNYPYVENIFWYAERDRVMPPNPDPHTESVSNFGLMEPDLTPKPAYDALARTLLLPGDLCAGA